MKKRLLALSLAALMLLSTLIFTVAAEETPLTLVSAVISGKDTIRLTFSEPVKIDSTKPFMGIRMTTNKEGGYQSIKLGDDEAISQWYSDTINEVAGSNKTQYDWKLAMPTAFGGFENIYEMVSKSNPVLENYKNFYVLFCMEEKEYKPGTQLSQNSDPATLYNVSAVSDKTKKLSATKINAGGWDSVYIPIEVDTDVFMPDVEGAVPSISKGEIRDIEIENIFVANEKQIVFELSEDVQLVVPEGASLNADIRYLHGITKALVYTDINNDGVKEYLKKNGTIESYGNKLIWTATDEGPLAEMTLEQIINKDGFVTVIPPTEPDGKETVVDVISGAAKWKLSFNIEGVEDKRIPFPFDGYINNVRSAKDEFGILKATKGNTANHNFCSIAIDLLAKDSTLGQKENASLKYEDNLFQSIAELEIKETKILNDHQIEITFSEEAQIIGDPHPYVAVVYTDENGDIVQIDVNGDGTFDKTLTFNGYITVEGNKLVWTKYTTESTTMEQIFGKEGYEVYEGYEDWKVQLYILENEDLSGVIEEYRPAVIDCITSLDGTKALYGTKTTVVEGEFVPAQDLFFADLTELDKTNINAVYVPPQITPVTVDSLKILNERQVEITFSQAIELVETEMPTAVVRYVDANGKLVYVDKDGSPETQETPMVFEGELYSENGKLYWVADIEYVFADVIAKKGYEETDWTVELFIQDKDNKNSTAVKEYLIEFVDSIRAVEGNGLLQATSVGESIDSDIFTSDAFIGQENLNKVYYPYEPIALESVTILNREQVAIKFSNAITIVEDDNNPVYAGFKYVDPETNAVIYNGEKALVSSGTLSISKDSDDTLVLRLTDGTLPANVNDILNKKGFENVPGSADWNIVFVIEGRDTIKITKPQRGYIDNIQSVDGLGRFYCNVPNDDKKNDSHVVTDIKGTENSESPYIPGNMLPMTVTKAEVRDEKIIKIYFPYNVKLVGSNKASVSVRYVDENGNLIWMDEDGDGKKEPLQAYGTPTAAKNFISFTPNGGYLSKFNMEELMSMEGMDKHAGSDKWKVAICIEGMDGAGEQVPGYIENVQSVDGKYVLEATKPNDNGIYDGYYIFDIEGLENVNKPYVAEVIRPDWPEDTRTGVDIVSVKILDDTRIEIKFSEPVTSNSGVWSCIRYVKYNKDGKPNYSGYTDPKTGKTKVFQFGVKLDFKGTDTVIGYLDTQETMSEIMNMTVWGGVAYNKGYDVLFCIEGLPSDVVKKPQLAYIDNITSLNGKRLLKGLYSCRDENKRIYDATYHPIDGIQNAKKKWTAPYRPYLTLDNVRVLNAFQLELTFSEPIKQVGNVFAAIRYVTKDGLNYQYDHDLGMHLQWDGKITCNNTNVVKWTLKNTSTKTLEDLIAMKGYENKKNEWYVSFCIEGLPEASITDLQYGYIENIQSLDGTKVLKGTHKKFDMNKKIYDGFYYIKKFQDIENAKNSIIEEEEKVGVEVVKVQILDDYQLKIEFSEPVKLLGEGTQATQYCPVYAGIRFTDMNLETQILNGLTLDFSGDFSLTEDGTAAIWQIRNQSQTIEELLTNPDYADFIPNFCIQETEDMYEIPTPLSGYIDNIQNIDGTLSLVATKDDMFGVADEFFTSDILPKEKDPNAIEKVESELIDYSKMTNAQREAFLALSVEEHNNIIVKAEELLEAAVYNKFEGKTLKTYKKLLSANGVSASEVRGLTISVAENLNALVPLSFSYDLSEMQIPATENMYVYRINADGTVTAINDVIVTVADDMIKEVKFTSDVVADFVIANKAMGTNLGGGILLYIIIALILILAAAVVFVFLKKKKKNENK